MNKQELTEGNYYLVKHIGRSVAVKLESINVYDFGKRAITRFSCLKLETGRYIHFRSAVKFIRALTTDEITKALKK